MSTIAIIIVLLPPGSFLSCSADKLFFGVQSAAFSSHSRHSHAYHLCSSPAASSTAAALVPLSASALPLVAEAATTGRE
jgi:hypothetical protein